MQFKKNCVLHEMNNLICATCSTFYWILFYMQHIYWIFGWNYSCHVYMYIFIYIYICIYIYMYAYRLKILPAPPLASQERTYGSEYARLPRRPATHSIRQQTSAYVSILQRICSSPPPSCHTQHTSAYVSIRQHTSAYVSEYARLPHRPATHSNTSAYVSIR